MLTHSGSDCGGYDVWIEINVGNQTCNTTQIKEFSGGNTLLWFGKYLGSCQDIIFGRDLNMIDFKIKEPNGNDFCPKYFYGFMDGATFRSDIMDDWYEVSKTNNRNHVARRIHGIFELPKAGNF